MADLQIGLNSFQSFKFKEEFCLKDLSPMLKMAIVLEQLVTFFVTQIHKAWNCPLGMQVA